MDKKNNILKIDTGTYGPYETYTVEFIVEKYVVNETHSSLIQKHYFDKVKQKIGKTIYVAVQTKKDRSHYPCFYSAITYFIEQ
jgi:hypothetical protein